jgi:23S rRNA (cytidine1920-2'-O)/16S rRNA (cytidine1409-2'-O)-methyltransferase
MSKTRLDVLLFERGLTESRERAKTTIMSGVVFVDDRRVDKPGTEVADDSRIEIRGNLLPYVSRGGLKLQKALDVFGVSPEGKICLDCGASTGGFTDCLLQRGAIRVYAVDVGYGQLAWSIRSDPRVVAMERTNIRFVTKKQVPEEIALAVIDVSFISLKLVLPVVRNLLCPDGEVICLIKPQFEAGREKVGKKGVVRGRETHEEVLADFIIHAEKAGFSVIHMTYSPVKGPEGNIEYLGHLGPQTGAAAAIDFKQVVADSHTELSDR